MDPDPPGDEPAAEAAPGDPHPAPTGAESSAARRAYHLFDDLTDLVVVLDETFSVTYVNEFARSLLGYHRGDVEGRPITDFLDDDGTVRAFEVAALMASNDVVVPVTPALYDVRCADGRWIPVELNAVQPPQGFPPGHLLVVGRYSGDHHLQNRILELITTTSDDAELIAIIPGFGSWRHPHEQYAVIYSDTAGADHVTGTDIVTRLVTDHPGGSAPWARARRDGETVLIDAVDLPSVLRTEAEAAGLGTCWAVPVADPLHDVPAVLVGWSRIDGPPSSVHRYALDTMARMLTLILQWRRQREALERAARRDPLTEVVNRAGFFEVLADALAHATAQALVGLLYIDLDGFKAINDGHGHSVGDEVLRIVAGRLSSAVRRGDLIGRLGGDEFAVLCPSVGDVESLTAIARRIIDDLAAPIAIRGLELQIGASIGIATAAGSVVPDQLVDAADRSLYLAKADGRGRWHLADDGAPLLADRPAEPTPSDEISPLMRPEPS